MDTWAGTRLRYDSVTAYLSREHARLDALLREAETRVEDARWPDAAESHAVLERDMQRHMRLEEEIVFPLFEARSGVVDGPTAVMLNEHRSIRQALSMMRAGIESGDACAYADAVAFLNSVRGAHDAKEEHILFPMTDRLLSLHERARVAARLQRE